MCRRAVRFIDEPQTDARRVHMNGPTNVIGVLSKPSKLAGNRCSQFERHHGATSVSYPYRSGQYQIPASAIR